MLRERAAQTSSDCKPKPRSDCAKLSPTVTSEFARPFESRLGLETEHKTRALYRRLLSQDPSNRLAVCG